MTAGKTPDIPLDVLFLDVPIVEANIRVREVSIIFFVFALFPTPELT